MVSNSRGDVVGIVNGNGVMIVNYEYDAWGNVLSVTDQNGAAITSSGHLGNLNSLRYRGYYYDTDLEMYYLQSRYYDPEIRRFINADDVSVLSTMLSNLAENNLFTYCLNNPVNMIDFIGEKARKIYKTSTDSFGVEILMHYLYGKGKKFVKVNGKWGKYMMANKLLKSGVINVLFPIARKLKKGQSRVIQKTISMIIDTGENINGYQYLHGTNSRVGGFQMYGKISKLLNGTVIYDMTYVWNDIIDPNYTYDSDRIKAKIAKIIANPKNYVIKIIWNDISVIYPNTGKGTGWLGKR